MNIKGSIVLVTGANRGIGRAYVEGLLQRGAAKIYLGARDPASLAELLKGGDSRLVPLKLDVTDRAHVAEAARAAKDVTLLINNAGFAGDGSAYTTFNPANARQEMEVNYFGLLAMSNAFAPILKANGGGVLVNVLSMLSLVSIPLVATYSASKAAALAVTDSLRAELAGQGTKVVSVMPVQVETEMGQLFPPPRVTTQEVVDETFDAVEQGRDEVFPGEQTKKSAKDFAADPKAVQAYLSTLLPTAV